MPRSYKRSAILPVLVGCLFVGLVSGCSRGPEPEKEVTLSEGTSRVDFVRMKVSYKDNEVFEGEMGQFTSIRVPASTRDSELRVSVFGPDGWTDSNARLTGGKLLPTKLQTGLPRIVLLYIDLKQDETAEFVCGKLQFSVMRSKTFRTYIPGPQRATMLSMNGKELGNIEGLRTYLIDPTGTRSYRYRQLFYHRKGDTDKDPSGESPIDVVLRDSLLHQLPGHVDHFLESAPTTLDANYGIFARRNELTRVE